MLLAGSVLFFTACAAPEEENAGETTTHGSETELAAEEATSTSRQLSDEYYRSLITDGQYQTSANRGATLGTNSNYNLKAFETGLLEISQEHFSTDNHLIQEGQYLDSSTVNKWLERYRPEGKGFNQYGDPITVDESSQNLEGLNPQHNGSKEPDERTPIFLESILEQNYVTETENGYKLSGISIGLAMNTVDYYQKKQFDATFETKISEEELIQQGKEMADKIIERMRQVEGLEEIPIVVGIFKQTPQDSLAGGSYVAEGVSENGSNSVGGWTNLSVKKLVFPLQGGESTELNSFQNFKSEVESFFPNLSGVTAEATYIDDTLVKMKVDIVTQFYGETEVIAFTQHVYDQAVKFLPPNIPIEISISSIKGMEAFLARETGENQFYSHVFD